MYQASVVLSEDDWQIEVLVSIHEYKQEAKDMASSVNNSLLTVHDGIPVVQLCSKGKTLYRCDKEVIVIPNRKHME